MTKKYPKISIIVPVYNKEKYLKQCLDSLVFQTYSNIEIVCVNDGSTDDSLMILQKYAKKYKNIKVINQENKGVNGARITGYNNATGKYIAWVDADDFVEIEMYEKMYNLAENDNADIVICNYNFYPKTIQTKNKWYKPFTGKIEWKFILKNTIQCNKIVKKDLLEKIDIINLFSEFGEGCYSLALINAKSIATTDECLYNYRVGHKSLSTNYNNIEWYRVTAERALRKAKYIHEKQYSDEWQTFFYYVYLRYVLILMLVAAYNNRKDIYQNTKKILQKNDFFSKKYSVFYKEDFSMMKMFVIKNVCYRSYLCANIITKFVL